MKSCEYRQKDITKPPIVNFTVEISSSNMDEHLSCLYAQLKEFVRRSKQSSALALMLSSLVLNLPIWSGLLQGESIESDYVLFAWTSALFVCGVFTISTCLKSKKRCLKWCMAAAVLGSIAGLALGIVGILILTRDDAQPNEATAVVLINIPLQWILAFAELGAFCLLRKELREILKKKAENTVAPEFIIRELSAQHNVSIESAISVSIAPDCPNSLEQSSPADISISNLQDIQEIQKIPRRIPLGMDFSYEVASDIEMPTKKRGVAEKYRK